MYFLEDPEDKNKQVFLKITPFRLLKSIIKIKEQYQIQQDEGAWIFETLDSLDLFKSLAHTKTSEIKRDYSVNIDFEFDILQVVAKFEGVEQNISEARSILDELYQE